jgi:hypothetical protein
MELKAETKATAEKVSLQDWFARHAAGMAALVLGVISFIVVALVIADIEDIPDWRITVPFFAATVAAAVVSFARKEGTYAIPLLGVGLAAAAMVLGWFVALAIILAVTALVILIMSHVM